MSNEMIERVAKAIMIADLKIDASRYPDIELRVIEERTARLGEDYRILARAAIEAMKEPTPSMIKVGVEIALETSIHSGITWGAYVADKHRKMIDAALSEGEGS